MMPNGESRAFTQVLYGCEPTDVAKTVILTPRDETLEALRRRADDIRECKGFFRGFNGEINGFPVSVFNSRIGSPVASDCAYYLRFTPCRNIIYTGLIGSLQHEIRVGDLIVPTAAVRGEGASKYFVDESYPAVADFQLLKALSSTMDEVFNEYDIVIHYGPIYTTDSFAAETKDFLDLWRSRNLIGIDMETSAIYTLARLYGMRSISAHIVSDNPIIKKSFFDPISDAEKGRREKCEELLLDTVCRLLPKI